MQMPSTIFRQLLPHSDREANDRKIRKLRYKYIAFTSTHTDLVALLNCVKFAGTRSLLQYMTDVVAKQRHYITEVSQNALDTVRTHQCLFVWNRPGYLLPLRHECSQSILFILKTDKDMGAMNLAYTLLRFVEIEHAQRNDEAISVCHVTYEMNKTYTYGLITFNEGLHKNWEQVYNLADNHADGYMKIVTPKYGVKLLTSFNEPPETWMTEDFVSQAIWKAKELLQMSYPWYRPNA